MVWLRGRCWLYTSPTFLSDWSTRRTAFDDGIAGGHLAEGRDDALFCVLSAGGLLKLYPLPSRLRGT